MLRVIAGLAKACRNFGRHHPPTGLAFGEPDDRLRRMIQYAALPETFIPAGDYWIPAFAGMTAAPVERPSRLAGNDDCHTRIGIST
jgi:hypothetical protein